MLKKYTVEYSLHYRKHHPLERHYYYTDDPVACEEFVQGLLQHGMGLHGIKHDGMDLPRPEFDRIVKIAAAEVASKLICTSLNIKPEEERTASGLPPAPAASPGRGKGGCDTMNTDLQAEIGLLDAIFHRRAVRHYSDRAVDPAKVQQLLVAAVQAPSAMNLQPWAFAVFHGHKLVRDYAERAKRHLGATYPTMFELHSRSALYEKPEYDVFHGADTLVVIYATTGRLNPNEDCCLAAQNLMLAAHALGLGTCPIGFARPWLNLPEIKRELGVPEEYTAVFPVVVGYPAGPTEPTPRTEPNVLSWKWEQ